MNNIDLSKLKEYSKDDIHEMIINGEIDHDFICEYISKRDKVYNMLIDKVNELQQENQELKEQNERLLELCMYALISSTKIYNHELAIDTKKSFIDVIRNNLNYDTYTLRNKLLEAWRSDK